MQIRKGKDRIVLILPLLGTTIKFPIIHFFIAVRYFFYWKKRGYLKEYFSWPIETSGVRGFLFGGLSANWNEFLFLYLYIWLI